MIACVPTKKVWTLNDIAIFFAKHHYKKELNMSNNNE